MTTLNRARQLAGTEFDDMLDSEVLSTLAYSEKAMGREFEQSEASYFKDALRGRRDYLAKKAGVEQSKFDSRMYGSPVMTNTQDEPEGYLGD